MMIYSIYQKNTVIKTVLKRYNIPCEFSDKVISEAEKQEKIPLDLVKYVDFMKLV